MAILLKQAHSSGGPAAKVIASGACYSRWRMTAEDHWPMLAMLSVGG